MIFIEKNFGPYMEQNRDAIHVGTGVPRSGSSALRSSSRSGQRRLYRRRRIPACSCSSVARNPGERRADRAGVHQGADVRNRTPATR